MWTRFKVIDWNSISSDSLAVDLRLKIEDLEIWRLCRKQCYWWEIFRDSDGRINGWINKLLIWRWFNNSEEIRKHLSLSFSIPRSLLLSILDLEEEWVEEKIGKNTVCFKAWKSTRHFHQRQHQQQHQHQQQQHYRHHQHIIIIITCFPFLPSLQGFYNSIWFSIMLYKLNEAKSLSILHNPSPPTETIQTNKLIH